MDFSHLKSIAKAISKHAHDSEQIAVVLLSSKLARASKADPQDYTIGMVAKVVNRMAGEKQSFITRAELRELYNKLHSRGTKFASVCAEELGGETVLATPTLMDRSSEDTYGRVSQEITDSLIDPVLASALGDAFGTPTLPINATLTARAKTAVEAKVQSIPLRHTLTVVAAAEGLAVCQASFETPRGETSVLIPVTFEGQSAASPEVFIGNDGPEDLTTQALAGYVYRRAGARLQASARLVLRAAESIRGTLSKVSAVDLAVTKLHAETETAASWAAPQVIGQTFDIEPKNLVVATARYRDKNIESFAERFDTSIGRARHTHTPAVVNEGLAMVARAARSFGLTDAQVSCRDSDENQIFYAVASNVGRVAVTVPVTVTSGRLQPPTVMIANGSLEGFDQAGVDSVRAGQQMDHQTAAVASPNYGLKSSELVAMVRKASAEDNLAAAEDALNILSQSGDTRAYAVAFATYSEALTGRKTAVAEQKSQCTMQVTSSASIHKLCGHTGLPLFQTALDSTGHCVPAGRMRQDETGEARGTINSRIFQQS